MPRLKAHFITLNTPRTLYFIISLVIALIAVAAVFISSLAALPISNFWLMTVAYVVLALACVIRA